PTSALFRDGDDWAVFAIVKGKAELRRIEIGQRNRQEVEVTSGLSETDVVIEHPADRIQSGTPVQPRSEDRGEM
ncbi:MAG: hypothetical protein KDA66_21460, partial [Planctomycetaceae bacterium]|nr:hypothetical protein [Planctomycetaceae bacterium]